MRFATIVATVMSVFGLAVANPLQQIEGKDNLVSPGSSSPSLQKRDAFTCYGTSSATVSDCESVIDTIRTYGEEVFHLHSGLCLVWHEGTCGVRFCAVHYIQHQLNRTASWVADYLAAPLLANCIDGGANGIMGDSANINSNYGSYRLYISEYSGHD